MPLKDVRRFQRASLRGKVKYGPITPSFEGLCMSLGMGGMYIESDKLFPPSVHLVVSFPLPGRTKSIEVKGFIVYSLKKGEGSGKCRGPGMGVKFTEVNPEDERHIHDYVVMKGRILRELKFLLSQEPPPMKRINDLLTSTYITDYTSMKDLRAKVDREIAFLKLTKG